MSQIFTVPLSSVMKELGLETIYMPENGENILISSKDVNRPGVEFTGFLDFYDNKRILVVGHTENAFLGRYSQEERERALEGLISRKPPAIIICRSLKPYPEMMEAAKRHGVALLGTADTTSSLVAALVSYMNVELAPRVTRHGVLVEVYGEGILLVGDSGVGKSETAIELIKRGHRLIADDAVEIRRVSKKSLVGTAPENIRHFIELRGIGIINARRIFGMGAVKLTEKIDIVINLEIWDKTKVYDRMGMENEYTEILGLRVPVLTIPVKPGRNLAVIIEVAAMNNRQKKMGYNAAKELLQNLGMAYNDDDNGNPKINWNL
ncbi:HPr(Ser) kinase/phosphatase [[Clostridium] leptum]|uniref:HPr kinase/phosphorylase n=1 Tax=[Clostridium] leptum TaxID=1535 RepID=A0A412AWH9_9FIRM|nr:HPr(Ser) kinase/phosphatase [[Clostridium] leptum]